MMYKIFYLHEICVRCSTVIDASIMVVMHTCQHINPFYHIHKTLKFPQTLKLAILLKQPMTGPSSYSTGIMHWSDCSYVAHLLFIDLM